MIAVGVEQSRTFLYQRLDFVRGNRVARAEFRLDVDAFQIGRRESSFGRHG